MAEYRIEPFKPENFPSLQKLFKSFFREQVSIEEFEKKYNTEAIGGRAISFIAIDNNTNEVVSYYAALPFTAMASGKKLLGAQASDAMTNEKHRRKGLFKQLAERVHRTCISRGIHFIISQPNTESYHSFINVFHFNYADDIIRWDLKLKIKTAPLAKIAHRIKCDRLFKNYCSLILKRYIVKQPNIFTNPIATEDIRLLRDNKYLAYKQSKDKFFIKIDEAVLWIRLMDLLWIGDIEDYEKVTLKVLQKLKRITFFLGYNTISFHLNKKVPQPGFLEHFKTYKSEPSTIYYIDKNYSSYNVILTGADFDTW